ncbi:3-methyladenine DNA glycosylase [Streptomyces eurocidicus]|uniref:3-methyladenine DNA glycosylase n=1 Tax=Streptomyces eurocidicus TaxID=66423 RepID=A0A2N8NM29_STREU|nr:3-methyladenine DNA glycosylase [Streptomyces eurocidicus]MBB5123010.1 3-methyladenine DNA glycosylase/8-oxoguanine DNA glycosylase [Streptomyces eurocidicus]MBF6054883.1 DNA-3-methyladenine glycosylase 2 family protein [Streptomyces eurocidicus]PNE29822.1 3-methyladenine DNA glycosylase [Streptomyces eurocidicus]
MATRTWTPSGPYDLGRTLDVLARGPGDPAYRKGPDGSVWRATRTPAGPGTLHVATGEGRVRAEAWGPGADWLLETLPTLLGATDDPAAFVPRHRLLHDAHRRHPGLRLARTGLVLESLIPSILEQKVTSDEAYRAWRLLLQRHGEPAPGPVPRMRVMPEPRAWALIPSWEWHKAGVDGKRSAAIVRAARVAARLEEAAAMDGPSAAARLQAVPGIGPWTAAETVQRSNGAPDAVTVGDLHLPRTVGYALTGARGTDDAGMLDLLSPYEGQRHRACRLICLMTRAQPRRAPRLSVNDVRAI